MFNQIRFVHNSKGQSLIEVMIVLIVSAVVLGALITAILNSLKEAQFAQNQTKATKYAQETIDDIRSIRDQDSAVSVDLNCNIKKFSDLWGYFMSSTNRSNCASGNSPCLSIALPTGLSINGCYFLLNQSGSTFSLSEPPVSESSYYYQPLDNTFSRLINLSDNSLGTYCPNSSTIYCDYQNEKIVNVQVQWTDGSGTHQSNLQTILGPRYEN